jgi:hypothetical protein
MTEPTEVRSDAADHTDWVPPICFASYALGILAAIIDIMIGR